MRLWASVSAARVELLGHRYAETMSGPCREILPPSGDAEAQRPAYVIGWGRGLDIGRRRHHCAAPGLGEVRERRGNSMGRARPRGEVRERPYLLSFSDSH